MLNASRRRFGAPRADVRGGACWASSPATPSSRSRWTRLGLHRHPEPRPRRVLRARRLRDGHVPHARRSRARASTRASCPTSWCSSTGRSCPGSGRGSTTSGSRSGDGARRARRARVRLRVLRVPFAHPRRLLLDHHAGADLRADALVLPERHRLRRQQRPDRLQAHLRLLAARSDRRSSASTCCRRSMLCSCTCCAGSS